MFTWIKSFVEDRVISLAIGFLVAKAAVLASHVGGVTVDQTALQASAFAGYQAIAHWVEKKTAGTKWEWLGQIL